MHDCTDLCIDITRRVEKRFDNFFVAFVDSNMQRRTFVLVELIAICPSLKQSCSC